MYGGGDNLPGKNNTDPGILDRSEWKIMEENSGIRYKVDYEFSATHTHTHTHIYIYRLICLGVRIIFLGRTTRIQE